ncbi:MAG: superoxide dismutase [Ni] [Pseudomonadota bacterium]
MKKLFLVTLISFCLFSKNVQAHCEIPCGIFNDSLRFDLMLEDATTIEKSMNEINKISAEANPDYHTISRWTMNKEDHANKIMHLVAQYFLAQRIKLPKENASEEELSDYSKSIELLHKITIRAMKTKYSSNINAVDDLRNVVNEFRDHYYKDHDKAHDHKH